MDGGMESEWDAMPFWECFLLVSFVATDRKSQLKPALCSSNKCSSCFYCCAINGFYGFMLGIKALFLCAFAASIRDCMACSVPASSALIFQLTLTDCSEK